MADADGSRCGRAAGIAYLITIASGMFAEAYARGSIFVDGQPGATAAKLAASGFLYRSSLLADAVMLGAYAVVTALLLRLFWSVNASASLVAAFFSLVGIALLASATALLSIPLQHADSAYEVLRLHGSAYNITGLFFGPYCLLIGWLILRSTLIPRAIGWLMIAAGTVFVADSAITLVAPSLARQIPNGVMIISLIAEGSLALWLTALGPRPGTQEKSLA